jgi:UV DNA damage endonuclease
MRLGYACICLSLSQKFTTTRLKTVEQYGIKEIKFRTLWNFERLLDVIKWNKSNNVKLYRLSSELVPFGSHPISDGWDWWEDPDILKISEKIKEIIETEKMRITIHPGQFNIINSYDKLVRENTLRELLFQKRLLEHFSGTDMIIHVGGVYGNKKESLKHFIERYKELPEDLRKLLRIENDDKSYNIGEVFEICEEVKGIPLFDYHHDICLPSIPIGEVKKGLKTFWQDKKIKVHLSSGKDYKNDRKHSNLISRETWKEFNEDMGELDLDVMLETKFKNLSILDIRSNNI